MKKIEQLIAEIADAGCFSVMDQSAARSGHISTILGDARGVCLHQADADAYLALAITVLEQFSAAFPERREAFILRAPGRINLIGEHTDYNGLPVLPIAINRDIMLVVSPRSDASVNIHNADARFEPRTFEMSDRIEPYPLGDWGNYAKAAAQSLQQFFLERAGDPLRGFDAVVSGNISMASGLASSSAFVVACALAILVANEKEMDRAELADVLARGEQYVGTRGGGMDQAVCLLAQEDQALKIEFFPTRVEQIPLPPGHSFVVCHSMVEAPKTATARLAYNLRAAESRIAAALLGNALAGVAGAEKVSLERLGDLYSSALGLSEAEIDALVEKTLPEETYSLSKVASLLSINEKSVRRAYLSAFSDEEIRSSVGKLKLRSRCRHVLSEGRRVRRAAAALRACDVNEFGGLMYASHKSCANDYEISIPELDALVAIAGETGALGARLTGAGFGGCVINFVRDTDTSRFVEVIRKRYYDEYLLDRKRKQPALPRRIEHIFVCRAVRAAGRLFGT